MEKERYAVIMAGGSGRRFGGSVAKQYRMVAGKPVIIHTLQRFAQAGARIVVVVPEGDEIYLLKLIDRYMPELDCTIMIGGKERFFSVRNGITALYDAPAGSLVAVHDAVRPLLSREMIERAYDTAAKHGTAVPVVPVTDSVRMVDSNGGNHALDRSTLRAVQTPQVFDLALLLRAYSQDYRSDFTDDASVVEALGEKITLYDGEPTNFKITYPDDLKRAAAILRRND